MDELINKLTVLFADTYALYLKTQNYHWHVTGPQFKSFHELFEKQYIELAEGVDEIAEWIRIKGSKTLATFRELDSTKTIKDGNSDLNANDMVKDLALDHGVLIKDLNRTMRMAQEINDEGTANLIANRIEMHEKTKWMLDASCENA